MPSQNRSYPEFTPGDNPDYVVPVQIGDVWNLSVAITPERRGILGWFDPGANEMRCAVVDTFEDVFIDDVVPPGDERTIWESPVPDTHTIWTGTIWAWDGQLYSFISHWSNYLDLDEGWLEVYVADDIENPVVWTLLAEIQFFHADFDATASNSVREGGIPTVTETGNWVLPFTSWAAQAFSLIDVFSIYSSEDNGATWEQNVWFRKPPSGGGTAGPQSTTIAYSPDADAYWFGTHIGSTTQWRWYYSDNSTGVDVWDFDEILAAPTDTGVNPYYYIDNGTSVFVGMLGDGSMDIWEIPPGGDPADPSTWDDLGLRAIVCEGITDANGFQFIPIAWPTPDVFYGVVYTAKDRIAFTGLCVPIAPDPLYIPYKDRLIHTDIEDISIEVSQEHQFDNYKIFERWAMDYMEATGSGEACKVFIPWKEHSRQEPEVSAAQSWDNWKYIERWGQAVDAGICGCACTGAQDPPDRCALHIPWKDHLIGVDPLDEIAWALAGEREFDNWKTLERWANRYADGSCGCTA